MPRSRTKGPLQSPAAIPTGARNVRFFKSLELKQDGTFVARLNNRKKLAGEYTISSPRCPTNFELLTLGADDTEQLTFKIYRGKVADLELPNRTYGFTGEGFTPFNMELDVPEAPAADPNDGSYTTNADCDDLPRPRCFGAYSCEGTFESNMAAKACVWRSPVGGPCCGS